MKNIPKRKDIPANIMNKCSMKLNASGAANASRFVHRNDKTRKEAPGNNGIMSFLRFKI